MEKRIFTLEQYEKYITDGGDDFVCLEGALERQDRSEFDPIVWFVSDLLYYDSAKGAWGIEDIWREYIVCREVDGKLCAIEPYTELHLDEAAAKKVMALALEMQRRIDEMDDDYEPEGPLVY